MEKRQNVGTKSAFMPLFLYQKQNNKTEYKQTKTC